MGKKKSVRQPLLEADDEQHLPKIQVDDGTLVTEISESLAEAAQSDCEESGVDRQYTCRVSGPGVQSATANCPTHVLVELSDAATGLPCSQSQSITAELIPKATEEKQHALFKRRHRNHVSVNQQTTAIYKVSFTAASRGEHQLHIRIDGEEIRGSPCAIALYPDPKQLRKAVKEIPNRTGTRDVAVNSRSEIITSDFSKNEVLILDSQGEVIMNFDCRGPTGVAVDSDDNVYVSCAEQIQKFSRDGHLMKSVGKSGKKKGEFIRPEGLTCYNGRIYVCDTFNNRIQVFDTDLNYVKTIKSLGSDNVEFHHPWSIDIDSIGRAYIADQKNSRVLVINIYNGSLLQQIGHTGGKGKLNNPTSARLLGEFLYVSDDNNSRVAVFHASGEYITSFGTHDDADGKKYRGPFRICSDEQRCIYVFDLTSAHVF